MAREEIVSVVESYLDCFTSKDLSRVSFAENVTLEGPRMPKLTGKQSVCAFLQRIMFPAVKSVHVKQHVVEGAYVATVFDLETTDGVDHVCDLIKVVDGDIAEIRAFFYPREQRGP